MRVIAEKSAAKLKIAYDRKNEALIMAEKASDAKGSFMSRMSHDSGCLCRKYSRSLASGMNNHISKPINVDTLFEKLAAYIVKK